MRIDIHHTSVEVTEQGSGEPVLLLHSSGSSAAQWRSLAERLSSRYRVIAPNFLGYGGTAGWPGHEIFSLEQEAALVRGLLSRLDEPAHLVGHSYGGAVALNVARTGRGLLRSLTVIEPVAFYLLQGGDHIDAEALREIRSVARGISRALAEGDYAGGFGVFVDYWSGPGTWAGMAADKRALLTPLLAKIALEFHATLNEPVELERMAEIAVPTLIVQGGCTALPTRCICKRLSGAVPGAVLKTVPGAGHLLPMTHRDQVNTLIAAHVGENALQAAALAA